MTELEFSKLEPGDKILVRLDLEELEEDTVDSPGFDPLDHMIELAGEEILVERRHRFRNWVHAAGYWWPPEWVEGTREAHNYPTPSFDDLF